MHRGFNAEVRRVIIVGSLCTLFGLINGYLSLTLIIGGACYMAWMFWQIHQLDQWLSASESSDSRQSPPDASGIWGDIFDSIYRLQKRQRVEKRHMQAVINRVQDTTSALRDGVVLIDNRGNMEWWNRSAQRLLGFQDSDQGQALVNFIRSPRFVRYFDKGKYAEPLDLPSPRHQNKRLQFQLNRFGNNERLLVVRDITRLYKLERMRQDFVANVSHEMRTPLTVVRGYLETLGDSTQLPPAWQTPFAQMQQQTERMSLLVNDLITLSKLETDKSELNQLAVDLGPMLQSIKNEAQVFSGNKNHVITLDLCDQLSLQGIDTELHSAFSNLVFNAVKYTPDNGSITIRLERDEQGVQLSVSDDGIGIDYKHIPRLTERFYRVDSSRNSQTGGTGLGLAIVKHVLLRHNGRLTIDSRPNQGSRFCCHFPDSQIALTSQPTSEHSA